MTTDANTQGQQGETQGQGTPNAVTPTDARTYLADFVSDPQSLTTISDEDVIKYHGKVSARVTKELSEHAAKSQPVVPDKYDVKLPDGALLDPKFGERLAPIAKEFKLSNESAQKLANHIDSEVRGLWDAKTEEFNKVAREEWPAMVKADKELGGANYDASVSAANKALDKFATPEFVAILKETGYGNHPELVRVFAKIGKAMAEDTMHRGGAGEQQKSTADLLYGGSAQT